MYLSWFGLTRKDFIVKEVNLSDFYEKEPNKILYGFYLDNYQTVLMSYSSLVSNFEGSERIKEAVEAQINYIGSRFMVDAVLIDFLRVGPLKKVLNLDNKVHFRAFKEYQILVGELAKSGFRVFFTPELPNAGVTLFNSKEEAEKILDFLFYFRIQRPKDREIKSRLKINFLEDSIELFEFSSEEVYLRTKNGDNIGHTALTLGGSVSPFQYLIPIKDIDEVSGIKIRDSHNFIFLGISSSFAIVFPFSLENTWETRKQWRRPDHLLKKYKFEVDTFVNIFSKKYFYDFFKPTVQTYEKVYKDIILIEGNLEMITK